ncbi:OmpA family protein [Marivivens donghaensis]|uniref:OmpA family protein n=1 Tax=Marivivens donghaensis TaxID=1699413 RepID=A0ABX0VX13_9RHOB|nr:OmpA family protein [Marivivens donghaensis]NIY72605.1 OmpA family protein [Marivivens donghaensis]
MPRNSSRATTALVASLSLIVPNASFLGAAHAQELTTTPDGEPAVLLCEGGIIPPCENGEPTAIPLADPALVDALGQDKIVELTKQSQEEMGDIAPAEPANENAAEPATGDEPAQANPQADAAMEQAAEPAEPVAEEATADETDAVEAQESADGAAEEMAPEMTDAEAAPAEGEAVEGEMDAEVQAEIEAQSEAAPAADEATSEDAVEVEAEATEDGSVEAEASEEAEAAQEEMAPETTEAEAAPAEEGEMNADAEAEMEADAEMGAEAETTAEAEMTEEETASEEAAPAKEVSDEVAQQIAEEQAALEQAQQDMADQIAEMQAEMSAATDAEATTDEEAAAADEGAEEVAADDEPAVDPTAEEEEAAPLAASDENATDAEVTEETLTEEQVRSSDEDFEPTSANNAEASEDNGGLSNFEKALLVGLGAVAVGSLLDNGEEVVGNTGDRVIVQGPNGLQIYKNDDALLNQAGNDVKTETFADGSTRTTVTRPDGTQVLTIRDDLGRVVTRARILTDGTRINLITDAERAAEPVDVASLRETTRPAPSYSVNDADVARLIAALQAQKPQNVDRSYSLRQVREIRSVRELVPAIDLDTINFATGSAAISQAEITSLVRMGLLIEDMVQKNPNEIFLVEGHTDAVGSDVNNLGLSDRRAESVALAMTEYFDIPPENLVVQGYGERYLKVNTESAEQANRRATIRRITPLLDQVASAQ